jgi:hypothetical protein
LKELRRESITRKSNNGNHPNKKKKKVKEEAKQYSGADRQ